MDGQKRREAILTEIKKGKISASKLGKKFDVSRQVIVGDVALLRASGVQIVATARGYVLEEANQGYTGKVVVAHTPEQTEAELAIFVELGAKVIDVVVDHHIYGELTGSLGISSLEDVTDFIKRLKSSETKLLSELTGGIHIHTVECRDEAHFEEVIEKMKEKGYLLEE